MSEVKDMDAIVLAVAHNEFKTLSCEDIDAFYADGQKILLDIKGLFNRKDFENNGYLYWRL